MGNNVRILAIVIFCTQLSCAMTKDISSSLLTEQELAAYLEKELLFIKLLQTASSSEDLQSILLFFEQYTSFVQWRAYDFIRIVEQNPYLINQTTIVSILIIYNQQFISQIPATVYEKPLPLAKRHTIAKIQAKELVKKSKKKVSFDEKITTWFNDLGQNIAGLFKKND